LQAEGRPTAKYTLQMPKIDWEAWRERARGSILDVNDGIVSAAGVAEGFAGAGASLRALLLAGVVVILSGGMAAAGARYSEVRTEWEMNRALIAAERASIEADPDGELSELAGIYEAKGLHPELALQVARALTERDPVAAHADAEHRLNDLGDKSSAISEGLTAGLAYAAGAAIPLAAMQWLPDSQRTLTTFGAVLVALALTGWLASWLTGLPLVRLIRRNVLLGGATMAAGLIVGYSLDL
jgi:VIT1/CCC1 family predicted Fe2+/Mn2+ transporter